MHDILQFSDCHHEILSAASTPYLSRLMISYILEYNYKNDNSTNFNIYSDYLLIKKYVGKLFPQFKLSLSQIPNFRIRCKFNFIDTKSLKTIGAILYDYYFDFISKIGPFINSARLEWLTS